MGYFCINFRPIKHLFDHFIKSLLHQNPDLLSLTRFFTIQKCISFSLFQLSRKHDDFMVLDTIGFTHIYRPIYLATLSTNPKNITSEKRAIFLECGIHSNEWITPAFCLYTIKKLIDSGQSGPLKDFDFYILPLLNPDGYDYSWENVRLWRKNRRPANCTGLVKNFVHEQQKAAQEIFFANDETDCYGVDINRNFEISFGQGENEDDVFSGSYRGPSAFSEPESRALRNFFQKLHAKYGSQK